MNPQTIVRVRRRRQFVIVDRAIAEDPRLRIDTKGLLFCLLAKPDDWQVRVSYLLRSLGVGRDRIYRMLHELRVAGHAHFERIRDDTGRISHGVWTIYESADPPRPGFPDEAQPEEAQPEEANPDELLNTELHLRSGIHQRTTTTKKPSGAEIVDEDETRNLVWPDELTTAVRDAAQRLLRIVPADQRQDVLDEWAGVMVYGKIKKSTIGCLRGIANNAIAGRFELELGWKIRERRRNEAHLRAAYERSRSAVETKS